MRLFEPSGWLLQKMVDRAMAKAAAHDAEAREQATLKKEARALWLMERSLVVEAKQRRHQMLYGVEL